jgi:hypothetical protein
MIQIFKKLFGSKKELPFNLHHPEIAQNVEFAFECKGIKYYRMSQDFRLPTGRFKFLDAYLAEHEMRMSVPMMLAYLDKIEGSLNGTGRNGQINLTTALVNIHNMRTHANLAFLPDNIERLASVVYFDETEDLRDYDPIHAKKKITDWKSDGKYSFFLTRPICELLNIQGISIESLETSIQASKIILRELTSDQQTPSLDNSSETETLK